MKIISCEKCTCRKCSNEECVYSCKNQIKNCDMGIDIPCDYFKIKEA